MGQEADLIQLVNNTIISNGRKTVAANHRVLLAAIISAIFNIPDGEFRVFKGLGNNVIGVNEKNDFRISIDQVSGNLIIQPFDGNDFVPGGEFPKV